MKGNEIVLSTPPRGVWIEGILGDASLPGTCMQIQLGTAPTNGRHTWVHYQPGADNDPALTCILVNDWTQGQLPTTLTPSAVGSLVRLYMPIAGEELNVLVEGEAGTGSANAFTIGERLQPVNATGMYKKQATHTAAAPFVVMEHIDEVPNTATLVWCMKQ